MNINTRDKLLRLSSSEKAFKTAYENGHQNLLKSSMTYSQYVAYLQDGQCITIPESRYYRDMSQEYLGNTIIDVENITNGNEIHMTVHSRYSYPVMHNHSYIELIYVYSGTCTHFVEDKEFSMKQGDLCLLAPHAMHAISATSDDTIVMNIMLSRHLFDRSFLNLLRGGKVLMKFFEDLFFKKNFISPYIIYPTGSDNDIQSLFEQMYKESDQKQYAYLRSLLLLVQTLFIHLIRKYEMTAIVTTSTENSFNNHAVSVLGYLSLNYYHTSLNETAAFFGYAPNYLGKMLKHYTGKTYTEIILEYQLENACKLLEKSDMSITDISQEIGCFDASHFTRKFKKKYGISPTEYRIQQKK